MITCRLRAHRSRAVLRAPTRFGPDAVVCVASPDAVDEVAQSRGPVALRCSALPLLLHQELLERRRIDARHAETLPQALGGVDEVTLEIAVVDRDVGVFAILFERQRPEGAEPIEPSGEILGV